MKRILKTEIPIDDQWHTVETGDVLHVGQQRDMAVTFWWEETADVRTRRLRVFGTGREVPDATTYVGTVQANDGLVWHLFEEGSRPTVTFTSAVIEGLDPKAIAAEVRRIVDQELRAGGGA